MTAANRTDEELVAATLGGELAAYDQLMQRYERMIYSLVISFADGHEGALDLTQEIFLNAYRKLAAFDGRGTLKAWLARIAINQGINSAQSASRRRARHQAWHMVHDDHLPPSQDHDLLAGERKR